MLLKVSLSFSDSEQLDTQNEVCKNQYFIFNVRTFSGFGELRVNYNFLAFMLCDTVYPWLEYFGLTIDDSDWSSDEIEINKCMLKIFRGEFEWSKLNLNEHNLYSENLTEKNSIKVFEQRRIMYLTKQQLSECHTIPRFLPSGRFRRRKALKNARIFRRS